VERLSPISCVLFVKHCGMESVFLVRKWEMLAPSIAQIGVRGVSLNAVTSFNVRRYDNTRKLRCRNMHFTHIPTRHRVILIVHNFLYTKRSTDCLPRPHHNKTGLIQKKYGLPDRPTNWQIERHCIHGTYVKLKTIKSV
jgi:hypothetical protein